MGAMALGYYIGGMMADRHPSFVVLATIASLAGLYTFLIPYFSRPVCEGVAGAVRHRALAPLLACALLFFVPSFLLAMVSPFAIKLNATSLAGVGGVAGRLYALSTAGSIVGTLLTTFGLIPVLEVPSVMRGLGVALIVISVGSLTAFLWALKRFGREDRTGTAMMATIALICVEAWALVPVNPRVDRDERLLHYEGSAYHDITVSENIIDPEGWLLEPQRVRRWMKFNEMRESGIYPYHASYLNAVTYSNLMHLPILWVREPKTILVVGGGGGVVPSQYVLHYPSVTRADVLELDDRVEVAARRYFQMPDNNLPDAQRRLRFVIGDARLNLRDMPGGYDIIFLDAYSSGGQIPFHLLTWEFLKECRDKLSPRGVLVTNIISAVQNEEPPVREPAQLLFAEVKTLRASEAEAKGLAKPTAEQAQPLFRQLYIFPRRDRGERWHPDEDVNIIVVATREQVPLPKAEIERLAEELSTGKEPYVKVRADPLWEPDIANVYLERAKQLYGQARDPAAARPSARELAGVPILRDDFAPVDTMYRPFENMRRLR